MEFPMYFSLVPTPGFTDSYLETCGIEFGEFWLFHGSWNGSAWLWGGNCSIEGKLYSLVKIRNSRECLRQCSFVQFNARKKRKENTKRAQTVS